MNKQISKALLAIVVLVIILTFFIQFDPRFTDQPNDTVNNSITEQDGTIITGAEMDHYIDSIAVMAIAREESRLSTPEELERLGEIIEEFKNLE